MKHCHEICIHDDTLYLTSTGFDSLLEFNLTSRSFTKGYCLRDQFLGRRLKSARVRLPRLFSNILPTLNPMVTVFDPNSNGGPEAGDTLHINNVTYRCERLFFCGTGYSWLHYIEEKKVYRYGRVPNGTHNAQPFQNGMIMNDTRQGQVVSTNLEGKKVESFPIIQYPNEQLLMTQVPSDWARQGFGRGLCHTEDGLIIGGSSPSTISVYCLGHPKPIKTINVTRDIRHAVHGLAIYTP